MSVPVPLLVKQIKAAHDAAFGFAQKSVVSVLECGRLLKLLKLELSQNEMWVNKVEEIGLAKRTADRYIAVADQAAKNPAKTKYLLEQGASLVDLYRAFDLVKPVQPGPYKPEDYQDRKKSAQLTIDFSYEEFTPHLKSLLKARNVEELAASTLQRLRTELIEAKERIDAVLADKSALPITPDHQP